MTEPFWTITTRWVSEEEADVLMSALNEGMDWAMGVTHLHTTQRRRAVALLKRMGIKILCAGRIPDDDSYYHTEPTKWRR